MKKKRFTLNLPGGHEWSFYAEDWDDAQNILFDMLSLEEEEKFLTPDELRQAALEEKFDAMRKEA